MSSSSNPYAHLVIGDNDMLQAEGSSSVVTNDDDSSSDEDMLYQEAKVVDETNEDYDRTAPVNTKRAYDPKIKEFKIWCDKKYSSLPAEQRYTVTGPKLHLFLKKEVIYAILCEYLNRYVY